MLACRRSCRTTRRDHSRRRRSTKGRYRIERTVSASTGRCRRRAHCHRSRRRRSTPAGRTASTGARAAGTGPARTAAAVAASPSHALEAGRAHRARQTAAVEADGPGRARAATANGAAAAAALRSRGATATASLSAASGSAAGCAAGAESCLVVAATAEQQDEHRCGNPGERSVPVHHQTLRSPENAVERCGPTSRQTPGSEQPYAETMHAAHDGGWLPHASGTTTHVGLSVGSPMPPSMGKPPYCPKLTQSSPGRHRWSPHATPHDPAVDAHAHVPCDPDVTQVRLWPRSGAVARFALVWYVGSQASPSVRSRSTRTDQAAAAPASDAGAVHVAAARELLGSAITAPGAGQCPAGTSRRTRPTLHRILCCRRHAHRRSRPLVHRHRSFLLHRPCPYRRRHRSSGSTRRMKE